MDALHQKMMSLGKGLEFRRHHEGGPGLPRRDGLPDAGQDLFFVGGVTGHLPWLQFRMILAEPVPDGFLRQHFSWEEPDWYGRPSVEVHYTDVEVVHSASGTEAA